MTAVDLAIEARNLGKQYRIGSIEDQSGYGTLSGTLSGFARRVRTRRPRTTFWALDDVSFDVRRGEAIGVIGHNGAGKTTLLKLLTRVTPPTRGRARIRGRFGSLLEVGTGFHPELTGRENIYFNGAILGMKKREIDRKFDEIVSFAEVEQFIETPVKRYSTGMEVRLGFAVAAFLDADILMVDEVLSVGDFGFQRRCLQKMEEQTATEGRTVVFVSHNLGAIKALTDRCLWLEKGRIRESGPTEDVFRSYVSHHREGFGSGFADLSDLRAGRPPNPLAQTVTFESLKLENVGGETTDVFLEGDPIALRIRLRARSPVRGLRLEIGCRVSTLEGIVLFSSRTGAQEVELEPGCYETSLVIDPNVLAAGAFYLDLFAATMSEHASSKEQDAVRPAASFHVEENPTARELRYARDERAGLLRVGYEWRSLSQVEDLTPDVG